MILKPIAMASAILFAFFAIGSMLHDFAAYDPVADFSGQPGRLLVAVASGIIVGLGCWGFHRLTPEWQRGMHLLLLGLAIGLMVVAGTWFGLMCARIASFSTGLPGLVPLAFSAVAAMLWIEFWQVFRKRV